MYLRRNIEEQTEAQGSKLILVLITLYMASVLLFTRYQSLNVISQGIFVLAFGSCAAYMVFKGKNFRIDTFIILFTAFIAFCFIGLSWAVDVDNSIEAIITLVQLLIMSVILFSYISAYENIDSFIYGLMISGVICAIVVIEYYGFSEYIRLMMLGQRLGGGITNVNVIGIYLSVTVIIAFYYGYFAEKKYCYFLMMLPLLAAFGTGSRKALAMIALGIMILMFMKYRESISLTAFAKFLGVAIVFLIILNWMSTMPIFQGVFSRISTMFGDESTALDSSAQNRYDMIRAGWDAFLKRPYTGVGINNSYVIAMERVGYSTYLHNNFIELLACMGIVGFIIYYGIYIYLIRNLYVIALATENPSATVMFAIIVSHFIMEFGMVAYYSKMTYVYFAMAAATIAICRRKMIEHDMTVEQEIELLGNEQGEQI